MSEANDVFKNVPEIIKEAVRSLSRLFEDPDSAYDCLAMHTILLTQTKRYNLEAKIWEESRMFDDRPLPISILREKIRDAKEEYLKSPNNFKDLNQATAVKNNIWWIFQECSFDYEDGDKEIYGGVAERPYVIDKSKRNLGYPYEFFSDDAGPEL